MGTISVVLSMLAAVVFSGIVVRAIPLAVPTPLVQIALGAAIATASHHEVELDPDIFFLLFLPPLSACSSRSARTSLLSTSDAQAYLRPWPPASP